MSYCCRFCGSSLEHTFVDLGMSPLGENFLEFDQLNQMEPFYPLHAYLCDRCFLVQLPEFVNREQIFSNYVYFSSYSNTRVQQAKRFSEVMMEKFRLHRRSQVIELGSNDGYLLQHFVSRGVPILGIEPAANVAEAAIAKGIPTVVEFFGAQTAREVAQARQADLIIANNVLLFIPNLNDFIKGLKILLKPQGAIVMEFPHLMRLMEGNQFDVIYHENCSYFSFLTVEKMLAACNLVIFDVEELPIYGGSLRIYARHAQDTAQPISRRVTALKAAEEAEGFTRLERYSAFAEKVKETKRRLLDFLIKVKRQGKSVAGYGAPGKGNTLLNYCGLRGNFIDYTVDRNPHKQGKFLPGTHLPIFHPDKVKETKPDYLLILPWNFTDEIRQQMSYIHEWGGQFVVAIPNVQVYR